MTGSARVVLAACVLAGAALAQGRATADAERGKVFLGDTLSFVVTVHDAEPLGAPELEGFDAFAVSSAGERRRTEIAGGRMRSVVSYVYTLRPKRAGRFTLPPVRVRTSTGALETRPVAVEVVAPGASELAVLSLEAEPRAVYPLQEAVIRLRVFVRALPEEHYGPLDPLAHVRPVLLQIGWLELPEGLAGAPVQEWLGDKVTGGRSGFAINELTVGSRMGAFFDDSRRAVFDLGGRRALPADRAGVEGLDPDADYRVYTLERRVRAERTGRYELPPALLKGRLPDEGAGRRVVEREVFTASDPLVLEVRPVPEEGRPAAWTGAIGRFQVQAGVSPDRARVGDPLTLTLRVRGDGNLEDIGPPPLDALEGSFRVHEASAATGDGERRFTWSVRPIEAGIDAVPPIALAAFDLDEGRYVVLRTEPLPIEVREAARLDPDEIASAAPRGGGAPEETDGGLLANVTDPARVRDESPRPRLVLGWVALLALAYVAFVVGHARWRRTHGDAAARRRRRAAARARERAAGDDAPTVLAGLAADAAGVPEAGLTARETLGLLERLGVEPRLRARVGEHLARAEEARYGGAGGGDPAVTRALVDEVVGALRGAGVLP